MNIEIQTVLNSQCVSFILEINQWISGYNLVRNNPLSRSFSLIRNINTLSNMWFTQKKCSNLCSVLLFSLWSIFWGKLFSTPHVLLFLSLTCSLSLSRVTYNNKTEKIWFYRGKKRSGSNHQWTNSISRVTSDIQDYW